MPEPASYQLLELLAARIAQITVANGYMSDLGNFAVVLDDSDLEADAVGTIVEAGLITVSSVTSEYINYELDIVVEFGVPRGDGSTSVKLLMHRAALDLSRALMIKGRDLPRYVRTFEQTGAQLFSGQTESGTSFLVAQVTARADLTDFKTPANP